MTSDIGRHLTVAEAAGTFSVYPLYGENVTRKGDAYAIAGAEHSNPYHPYSCQWYARDKDGKEYFTCDGKIAKHFRTYKSAQATVNRLNKRKEAK